ncbi:MAG: hypothetical protein DU429_07135 [Candidatus Tokpelaia sp.]|nr:MAG: hypothetical protein DU430_04595 [Candidatus Tokpelaia sp.]KAA6205992.1 MAG: hypothetical protein DU429_07135 [Candidatus Tokpelaia sp.]
MAYKLPEEFEKALLNLPEAEKEQLIVATMRAANIEIVGQKLENERLAIVHKILRLKRKYSKIAKTQNAGSIQVFPFLLP